MDRADVVEGLRPVLENGIDNPTFRAAVQSAITLLTPEPVTEEGLRAEGFRRDDCDLSWRIKIDETMLTYCPDGKPCDWWIEGPYDEEIALPGVESMQQLREVIKALRGKTNESEASRE